MKRVLIFGGSYFIGKKTISMIRERNLSWELTTVNRGTRMEPTIKVDREDVLSCRNLLEQSTGQKAQYDAVIDFSAYTPIHIQNVIPFLNTKLYCFISSGRASNPEPTDSSGVNKQACEWLVSNQFSQYLIIRPGYVVGEGDYSDRFIKHPTGEIYSFKDRPELVNQCIHVDLLSNIIINMVLIQKTGLMNLGYYAHS